MSSQMIEPGEGQIATHCQVARRASDSVRFTCADSGGPVGPMDFHFYQ